jgi:hypothetical protein
VTAGEHGDDVPGRRDRAEQAQDGRRGQAERGQCVSQRRAGRDGRRQHRVALVRADGALHAQPLGAAGRPADPAAHRVGRYGQLGADRPMALAAGAGQQRLPTTSMAYAWRAGAWAGSRTCVTAHAVHRARRGRSGVRPPQDKRNERALAKPHCRSAPAQLGQRSTAAARSGVPGPGRAPRSRPATPCIGRSSRPARQAGRGEWCCSLGPRTVRWQAADGCRRAALAVDVQAGQQAVAHDDIERDDRPSSPSMTREVLFVIIQRVVQQSVAATALARTCARSVTSFSVTPRPRRQHSRRERALCREQIVFDTRSRAAEATLQRPVDLRIVRHPLK